VRPRAAMKQVDTQTISNLLTELKQQYPPEMHEAARAGQPRDIEHVKLLYVENGTLLDLGGGTSTVNLALAQLGMQVYVVDIFEAYWQQHYGQAGMTQLRKLFDDAQVKLIDADLLTFDYRAHFGETRFDVITSSNCFEHLHHSPRPMLENCLPLLKPGGRVVFGVPNAVNIYKRLKVLFGKTNHPDYHKFYYQGTPWYGHIREYTTGDWRMLAGFLKLQDAQIRGYNWNLHTSKKMPRALVDPIDRLLRLFPSLCTDVYLIAKV
jgi:2-polyprenyl-3-methyl-5-hydroxy-6-metoxy-1,4-benzoquinol methylase